MDTVKFTINLEVLGKAYYTCNRFGDQTGEYVRLDEKDNEKVLVPVTLLRDCLSLPLLGTIAEIERNIQSLAILSSSDLVQNLISFRGTMSQIVKITSQVQALIPKDENSRDHAKSMVSQSDGSASDVCTPS